MKRVYFSSSPPSQLVGLMVVMSSSERLPRAWRSSLELVHCLVCCCLLIADSFVENVEKGPSDRPKVDVIIADCGEVCVCSWI